MSHLNSLFPFCDFLDDFARKGKTVPFFCQPKPEVLNLGAERKPALNSYEKQTCQHCCHYYYYYTRWCSWMQKIVKPVIMKPAENNLANSPSLNSEEKWVKFVKRWHQADTQTRCCLLLVVSSSKDFAATEYTHSETCLKITVNTVSRYYDASWFLVLLKEVSAVSARSCLVCINISNTTSEQFSQWVSGKTQL